MAKSYECFDRTINVITGEATNDRNTGKLIYTALCECNGNLLYAVRDVPHEKIGEDHVFHVLANVYETPLKRLMERLSENENLFVFLFSQQDSISTYTVFCGYEIETIKNIPVTSILGWIIEHCDFATAEYMYTEVYDGHQTNIDFGGK